MIKLNRFIKFSAMYKYEFRLFNHLFLLATSFSFVQNPGFINAYNIDLSIFTKFSLV